METARALGLLALVDQFLGQKWGHRRGDSAAHLTLIILVGIVAGAKDVDDIAAMRQDTGLQALLELAKWPSASTIKRFLYWFHELPQWAGGERGLATLPTESAALLALGKVNREIVSALQERRPFGTIKRSVLAVPAGVKKIAVRGDTAMYCPKALTWMDGRDIDFGISMSMVTELRARIEALPETSWSHHRKPNPFGGLIPTELEIAEVEFVSNAMATNKKGRPFRILVVRRVDDQRTLFGLAGKVRDEQGRRWYLALITNRWDKCRWPRSKR